MVGIVDFRYLSERPCKWCGQLFIPEKKLGGKRASQFCSEQCSLTSKEVHNTHMGEMKRAEYKRKHPNTRKSKLKQGVE